MSVARLCLPGGGDFRRFALNVEFIWQLLQAHPLGGLDAAEVCKIELARPNLMNRFLKQRLAVANSGLEMRDTSIVFEPSPTAAPAASARAPP